MHFLKNEILNRKALTRKLKLKMMTMETIDLGDGSGSAMPQSMEKSNDVPISLDQIHIETSEERCVFS